jgi:hypothetical protein
MLGSDTSSKCPQDDKPLLCILLSTSPLLDVSAGVAVSVARLHLLSASFPYVCCFDRFKKPLALLSMVGLVKLWDLFLKYKRRPDTNIYGTWYKVFSWALQICESNKTALSLGCLAIRFE